jgi:predicted SprT family Zn-dependent metalloprotease
MAQNVKRGMAKEVLKIEKRSRANAKQYARHQRLWLICRDCKERVQGIRKRFYKTTGFVDRCLKCGGQLDRDTKWMRDNR